MDNKYQFKVVNKYPYTTYERSTKEDGTRTYSVKNKHVPSVTTILSATKDKTGLNEWRKRIGEAKAQEIVKNSSNRGTEMHKVIECLMLGTPYINETPEGVQSRNMAYKIVDNMKGLNEIWGNEVSLNYKDQWAGTTDLICLYDNQPTIGDFKQANKPKREEWIEDYFCQLVAYSMAHKENYGEITLGKIFMCTPDLVFQTFELNNLNYNRFEKIWLGKVEKYYSTTTPEPAPQVSLQKV